MALLVLVLGASLPNRASAQDLPATYPDTSLRHAVTRIGADTNQTVRFATRTAGRLQGNNVSLRGDSVSLSTFSEILTIAVVDVDSMWVQRGTAAPIVSLIFGGPCASRALGESPWSGVRRLRAAASRDPRSLGRSRVGGAVEDLRGGRIAGARVRRAGRAPRKDPAHGQERSGPSGHACHHAGSHDRGSG